MRKLQSQGVHHITIVGADRADFDRFLGGHPRHAVRVRAAQPRQPVGEPSVLRPGRRSTDHDLHQRGPRWRPEPDADRSRLRSPHRAVRVPGHLPPGSRAARRARDPPQRRQGPRLHGLDLLRGSARSADRARVVPLRTAARLHARGGVARGPQDSRGAWRLQHRANPPRGCDRGARRGDHGRPYPRTDRPRTPISTKRSYNGPEEI